MTTLTESRKYIKVRTAIRKLFDSLPKYYTWKYDASNGSYAEVTYRALGEAALLRWKFDTLTTGLDRWRELHTWVFDLAKVLNTPVPSFTRPDPCAATESGRINSRKPNVSNTPKRGSFDYSGLKPEGRDVAIKTESGRIVDVTPIDPAHYRSDPSGVECIQVTEHRNFCVGNAIKYLWRNGLKGKRTTAKGRAKQIEDLKKARWYVDREIARLEKAK